jgi:hypothetical protein
MSDAVILGIAGSLLGLIGAGVGWTGRTALRAVQHRVEALETEVHQLRRRESARDQQAIRHAEWDARVRADLVAAGRPDPGPAPPLIPPLMEVSNVVS